MKITKISVYQVDLPLKEPTYEFADGKVVSVFDTTVVAVHTDAGIIGYGEVCPLGPNYLPSYANGVRTGIKELAPKLLGLNPLEIGKLNQIMDFNLKGHPYVKSPLDMACWDILGKHCGLPLVTLLGGRYGEHIDLYRAIGQLPPKEMALNVQKYFNDGYRKFQLKLGGNIDDDIERCKLSRDIIGKECILVGDANTAWLSHEAIKLSNALHDVDVYIEQPCATYDECLRVREHTNKPFILDENMDCMEMLIKAHSDRAIDCVNLKISRLGGITKTKLARDFCISQGIAMYIEDCWGSDIVTAALSHMFHSTPEKYRFATTDFNSYHSVNIATGVPERVNGTLKAPSKPGLGIEPMFDVLKSPVMEFS